MRTTPLVIVLAAILGGCTSTPAARRAGPAAGVPRAATRPMPAIVLTPEQGALVRAYYGSAGRGRGRAGGGLPPGIAKRVALGKPLPPGIAKQTLPGDLVRRLPLPPSGLHYAVVAGKLVLVEAATQIVRAVLLEAVFG